MIKRMYSLAVKKSHHDGNGSYSYRHFTFNRRSWFSHAEEDFAEAMDRMKVMMITEPGRELEVINFSRI